MRARVVSRSAIVGAIAGALALGPAGAAAACGGLIAPNGAVNLVRTTTLAAYHRGVEHYVTSFTFAGAGAREVGSIVPLPGVPTRVVRGGDWTLQRLLREVQPPIPSLAFEAAAGGAAAARAKVLLETTIDALDITVLKGGATAVGSWARDHGFFLPPDAPEVLEFYARRSPIFLAARFDADRAAAQGLQRGQGTPIEIVVPTPNPWVPLRILALGRQPTDTVEADVFLLTPRRPATLPKTVEPNGDGLQRGLVEVVSRPASDALLDDLRSDRGMEWVPRDMWLTYIDLAAPAKDLTYDLAIDASGFDAPDPSAAGYAPGSPSSHRGWVGMAVATTVLAGSVAAVAVARRQRVRRAAA
jgi:hypothetical protein